MKTLRAFLVLLSCLLLLLVSCASTSAMVSDSTVTDTEADLGDKLSALGFPEVEIRDIEVFYDGKIWLEETVKRVENAQRSILISSFLVSECEENEAFFQALVKKAHEGVEIYFIYDSASEVDMTESKYHIKSIEYLRDEGVHLFKYNPFSLNRLALGGKMLIREHRKQIIIDGHTVMTGGMNFNYMSDTSYETTGQRDAMYIFESPSAAAVLSSQFIQDWNRVSWDEIKSLPEAVSVSYPADSWMRAWIINQGESNVIMPLLFGSMFYSADEEILCLPLLPLLNKDMKKAVSDAVDRGVKFSLILPNDPRLMNFKAAHYSVKDLQDSGVDVYAEKALPETANLLHEKLIIVDSRYTMIGSANLNYRSMVLSNEIAVIVDSTSFASQIREHYLEYLENTDLISVEDASQWRNLSGFLFFIFSMIGG